MLCGQEKPAPDSCRGKTSCPSNGSFQHKNIFLFFCQGKSCMFLQGLVRKQNHPHYIGLTEHALKERLDKLNTSFKYESKGNPTEPSNLIWGKKKEKVNVNLDWSILDKAKPYSPASKKCMLCITEKYYIIFSTKNLRIY